MLPVPDSPGLSILQLLQFADSALPIGSASHSFGLEAMVFDEDIDPGVQVCAIALSGYLEDCLSESYLMDAVFCREAHSLSPEYSRLSDLNQQLSALKLAREQREASLTLGRRFASLAAAVYPHPAIASLADNGELHHAIAFGYTMEVLSLDPDVTVAAFLHQTVLNAISSAQRLMPLGQIQANRLAWDLKPAMLEAVARTRKLCSSTVHSFTHLPELASMRHTCLPTRLFVS